MSETIEKAKKYIAEENYKEALKIARKNHGKDNITTYINILNLLIDEEYLPALEEKGMYYQYYDKTHDNGDYGGKYFDLYLEKQPRSINVLCDKALSRFNKGHVTEALEYTDKAYDKYKSYSQIEKPRIKKKEVLMAKIELQIQAEQYSAALSNLNKYENQYNIDEKVLLYKGQMLQKTGENREAIDYLDKSLENEDTLLALNSKGDALYDLKEYNKALNIYDRCIKYEKTAEDDLKLVTNFNYKAGFCCVNLGDDQKAVKYLNKTINMLNEHGRLPNDLESIYQKCSFEKERILKSGDVQDEEFSKSHFLNVKTSIYILVVVLVLYLLLRLLGYN